MFLLFKGIEKQRSTPAVWPQKAASRISGGGSEEPGCRLPKGAVFQAGLPIEQKKTAPACQAGRFFFLPETQRTRGSACAAAMCDTSAHTCFRDSLGGTVAAVPHLR